MNQPQMNNPETICKSHLPLARTCIPFLCPRPSVSPAAPTYHCRSKCKNENENNNQEEAEF